MKRRHERLEQVSPEVGVLDEGALGQALEEDLDAGVSLLADLTRATDPKLRAEARKLAAALVIPACRRPGTSSAGGSARLGPVRGDGLDLDVDATLDRVGSYGHVSALTADDLRWRGWRRPGRAVVLLVDASGSVGGAPLHTAVVTAGALAARCGRLDEVGVVAFWSRAVVLRDIRDPSPPASVLVRLLALRGGDTTDLAAGLSAALSQVALATVGRRDIVVLTDGMANEGADPRPVAAAAWALGVPVHVLALDPDEEAVRACRALVDAGGGRFAVLSRPSEAPVAVAEVLR